MIMAETCALRLKQAAPNAKFRWLDGCWKHSTSASV